MWRPFSKVNERLTASTYCQIRNQPKIQLDTRKRQNVALFFEVGPEKHLVTNSKKSTDGADLRFSTRMAWRLSCRRWQCLEWWRSCSSLADLVELMVETPDVLPSSTASRGRSSTPATASTGPSSSSCSGGHGKKGEDITSEWWFQLPYLEYLRLQISTIKRICFKNTSDKLLLLMDQPMNMTYLPQCSPLWVPIWIGFNFSGSSIDVWQMQLDIQNNFFKLNFVGLKDWAVQLKFIRLWHMPQWQWYIVWHVFWWLLDIPGESTVMAQCTALRSKSSSANIQWGLMLWLFRTSFTCYNIVDQSVSNIHIRDVWGRSK